MKTKRPRAKPGDVLELRAADRFAYLHYIGRHPEYGDAVFVGPSLYEQSTALTPEIFANGYVTFYPATAALAQGLVEVVGHLPPPSLPSRLRRPGAISGRNIETWVIEDGASELVKTELSAAERQLPIASIWNHQYLVQRLTEKWDPTQTESRS